MKTKYKKHPHWQTALVAPKCICFQRRTLRAGARCERDNVIKFAYEDVDLYDVLIHRTVLEETRGRRGGGTSQTYCRNGNAYRYSLFLNFAPTSLTQESDDSIRRPNALLLRGKPIAHLSTKLIFEYITHCEAKPLGLEWVDDTTCVILFASSVAATTALSLLQRTASETPDECGFVQAKSVPMAFWPPKERIDASLGKGEGLKGALFLRWAEVTDVKQRGARSRSEFYRKHGADGPGGDARREDGQEAKRRKQEELDDELDAFLREESPDEASRPASPLSKMRSDYIEERKGGEKSLLERTSQMRAYFTDEEDTDSWKKGLETRITSPRETGRPRDVESARGSHRRGNWADGGEMRSRHGRPRKSQQELDDELDAFLNERE